MRTKFFIRKIQTFSEILKIIIYLFIPTIIFIEYSLTFIKFHSFFTFKLLSFHFGIIVRLDIKNIYIFGRY